MINRGPCFLARMLLMNVKHRDVILVSSFLCEFSRNFKHIAVIFTKRLKLEYLLNNSSNPLEAVMAKLDTHFVFNSNVVCGISKS